MNNIPLKFISRIALILVCVGVATLGTVGVQPLAARTPYGLFYAAVAIAGWFAGVRAGALTIALSLLSVEIFVHKVTPHSPFNITDWPVHLGFLLVSSLILALVAARRVAADALEREQIRFDHVLEHISEMFLSIDADWRISYLNGQARRMLERDDKVVLGTNLWQSFPNLLGTITEEKYREAMATGKDVQFEVQSPEGRWFLLHVYPGEGGLAVFVADISERKDADLQQQQLLAQLSAERRRVTDILKTVPGAVWEAWGKPDAQAQRVDFISEYIESMLGYTVDEWLAQPQFWATIVHPDDKAGAVERAAAHFAGGADVPNRFRWQTKDGRYIWVETRSRVIRDENGAPLGMRGVTIDISDLMRAEEERRALEQRFQLMADSAPVLVWIAGTDKLCNWFNRAWLEFAGRTMEQELGNGWAEGVHPDDLERCLHTYHSSFDARQPFIMEYRMRHHSGEYRWLLDNGVPLYGANQEFTGFIGTCVDITDIRLAQEERERLLAFERAARSEAERVSQLKDEFLTTLSHELRTPLNAILGWANLLRNGLTGEETVATGLETIERNARIQAQLIEDLLDMSRIISGKLRLDVQRVDLASSINSAIATILPAAQAKGIRIDKILDPLAAPISGDPNRIQQIVWNLLSNAVKFTPRDGKVQVILERVNSHVEITIADTGQGISPQFLPFVFERFRQADSSNTREHGGLGLGLGIVRQLVELHGGSVRAKSPGIGQGATFVVSLPVTVIQEQRNTSSTKEAMPCPPSLHNMHVLVVDDEPDARELVRVVLEKCGARVTTASSAEEAFQLVRQEHPDVLVSDIGMPEEDGYSLMRRVRALPPEAGGNIRSVALTALARSEDRQRALLAGFQMHLPKPVEPAELVAVVASVAGLTGRD
ncbi:MAG TPA: PAS domain-containing protein [Abditibacteriaceae bacterium]|jgi:PAS domain S-box-containing protein